MVYISVLLCLLLGWLGGLDLPCLASESRLVCPNGTAPDARRSDAIVRRLRRHKGGNRLVARLGQTPAICFGDLEEGGVLNDGVIILDPGLALPASAARLGHLLLHLVEGLPFDEDVARSGAPSCAETVKQARKKERRALAFENQLRKAFGIEPLPPQDHSEEYARRCEVLRRR